MPKSFPKCFVSGAILFFFLAGPLPAQENEIDSLKRILIAAPLSKKLEINYELGSLYFYDLPDSSRHYFRHALTLSRQSGNDTMTARSLNRIGMLNLSSGNYEEAIRDLFDSMKIFEHIRDTQRTVRCLQLLSSAYSEQGMLDKALGFAIQSVDLSSQIGDQYSEAVGMINAGSVYYDQGKNDQALIYFQQALIMMEEIEDPQGIADCLNNVALIHQEKRNFDQALHFHKRSLAMAKINDDPTGIAASFHNIGLVYQSLKQYPLAIQFLDSCVMISKQENDKVTLKESYNTLSDIYSDIGNFEKAYKSQLLFSNLNDTLMSEENKKQFAEMNARYEVEKKDNQITLLNKDRELGEEKMRKQRIIRNGFMGGFGIVLLFAGIFFSQRNKIKKGKRRSDELLLNILPAEVADELKAKGMATARQFDEVTVMFTDFKDFSQISEKLTPAELVSHIHECFKAFDDIISRYDIEKIKTIGDAYMCVGGLPVPNKTHAQDVVRAGLEIREYMLNYRAQQERENKIAFDIRIGIHTGPVVAGIVGVKKFAYDIWGDTVNIASRMESSGEESKVNISGTTYELVKDNFDCTYRGKIKAKNKGEIDMYFVERSYALN